VSQHWKEWQHKLQTWQKYAAHKHLMWKDEAQDYNGLHVTLALIKQERNKVEGSN